MSKYVLIGLMAALLALALSFFTGILSLILQAAGAVLLLLLTVLKYLFVSGFGLLAKAAVPLLAAALIVWVIVKLR